MKKFIKPAVRVIKYESSMLCGSIFDNGLGDKEVEGGDENSFAPTRYRGVFGEEGSLF